MNPAVERRLYLVRHAETDALTADGYMHSDDPIPLTERGVEQAEALGRAFEAIPVTEVHASPMDRTAHTARLLAGEGRPLKFDLRLREISLGDFDGAHTREVFAAAPRWLADPDAALPGGESLNAVVARAGAALDDILAASDERDVVVVAHGGVNRGLDRPPSRHADGARAPHPRRLGERQRARSGRGALVDRGPQLDARRGGRDRDRPRRADRPRRDAAPGPMTDAAPLTEADELFSHQLVAPRTVTLHEHPAWAERCYHLLMVDDDMILNTGRAVYPHDGRRTAFAGVVAQGSLHAHRAAEALAPGDDPDRPDVGPVRIEVIEPLRRVRLVLDDPGSPVSFDLVYEARFAPVATERNRIEVKGEVVTDYMNFFQSGRYSGVVSVDGRDTVVRDRAGFRDRGWGMRKHEGSPRRGLVRLRRRRAARRRPLRPALRDRLGQARLHQRMADGRERRGRPGRRRRARPRARRHPAALGTARPGVRLGRRARP